VPGLGFQVVNNLFKNFKEKKMKKLMVMVAALAMITGSAYAADWNFYGNARISTFYVDSETINKANSDTQNYEQALQGNSRIGATVKVSDELTAGFEYGTGVNVRKLYGEWDFGGGKFLVGQTYTPLNWFYSNQVYGTDNDLLAQGGVYSGREGMLQLTFGGFKIALLAPNVSYDTDKVIAALLVPAPDSPDATKAEVTAATETTIPGIEISYALALDAVTLKLGAGYQTFEGTLTEVATGDQMSDDVDSYVLALGAKSDFGAFWIAGNIYMGQNVGNMLAVDVDGSGDWEGGYAQITENGLLDNDALGMMVAAGFTINDMFIIEAGYGYVETELDVTGSTKDKAQSYYLNSTVTMAPGVFFVPEIGVIDGDENGDTETTYFGAKWQINF
jgi:hypothetical protein